MKHLSFALFLLLFAFVSCNNDKKDVQRFKDAAMKLDNTSFILDEYDDWPEGGIRNVGGHLASLISLDELQKMLPCPLYLFGPHQNGQWDLYNDDFGHYNAEAIQYLADLAKKVVADKKFVAASKPLVDKYLYLQMHSMMVLHDVFYSEEMFSHSARDEFFNDIVLHYGYSDGLYYFLDNVYIEDDSNVYSYYQREFAYFWARRYVDGTIDEFYDGLSAIFKAYYPDYVFDLDKYYWEPEWEDDWWFEEDSVETAYRWDLEPDEPVNDNDRIKENDAVEMLRDAATNLDKTHHVLVEEYDYWPECGIRVTGSHLFSLISLKTLNRMLPCDLYVSGPHHYNRWNLKNSDDFGHYNPEAVQYLGNLAKKVVADKKFIEQTKPLADEYLKRQMLIMRGLYDGLNDKDICQDKQAVFKDIMEHKGQLHYNWEDNLSGQFMSQLDLEDGSFVFSNTGGQFLYFWARRDADGTIEQFHDILETVYNAYYGE